MFDLRLYIDPYTIPGRVQFMRQKMLALGYDKPIISTEYGGPNFFEMPENLQYVPLVISWSQAVATGEGKRPEPNPITQPLREDEHPRRRRRCSCWAARPSWRRSTSGSSHGAW